MVDDGFDRRSFLKTGGAIAVSAGLSGCSRSSDDSDDAGSSTKPTTTETQPEDKSAELLRVDPGENFSMLPVVDSENSDNTAVVEWGVEDGDGVSQARLFIRGEDTERGIDISQGIQIDERRPGGEKTEGEASFPQQVIPPGNVRFRMEMTDDRGNDYWFRSEPYNAGPRKFRTDPEQDFSSYETERHWDNTQFTQQRINEQRSEWQDKARYDGFVDQIRNGGEGLEIEFGSLTYPDGGKEFDKQKYDRAESFRGKIAWLQIASVMRTYGEHDPPPSGHANEMAASIEKTLEELENIHESTRGWGIYNPGHGTMMFYTEDESAEHRWYHLDTTSEIIDRPENALEHRDIWSPFHSVEGNQPGFYKGFNVDEVEGVNSYNHAVTTAREALIGMVTNAANSENFKYDKTFMTDEWMDAAYSHIRDGGKIDPLLNPIEEVVEYQLKNDVFVGVYGLSIDDTRLAAGEDLGDLYDEVMVSEGNVSASQIENMLEGQAA